ncbi:MAG: NUDIX domain-containing protein [Gammaproteobacteria bacterium]|nr:NUDIX domain-containing protein [Gammaproteobacteria bacterium]MDE0247398.1 NUDIX domain-containing protein [Gammaproteobacteria bacterium]
MVPSDPERVDLFDADSIPLGRSIRRGEALGPGEYRLVVQVWVRNSRGEFLIQKRGLGLTEAPGLWAATAGWVVLGEDSSECAARELEEELGIRASPNELRMVLSRTVGVTLGSAWLLERDTGLEELSLDPDEVTETTWATEEEIRSMVRKGEFFDYGYEYFAKLFGT